MKHKGFTGTMHKPPSIHPYVIYFKKSDALNTEHENLVMISDCLKHDSILVHTFQQHLIKFIENTYESPLKKLFASLMGPTEKQKIAGPKPR
jgi:hypothetical protein